MLCLGIISRDDYEYLLHYECHRPLKWRRIVYPHSDSSQEIAGIKEVVASYSTRSSGSAILRKAIEQVRLYLNLKR